MGGSARHRDRACRSVAAPQPARADRSVPRRYRRRTSLPPALRRGCAEATTRDPGGSNPPAAVSHSRRLLRSYGAARRRTRNCHAAARDHSYSHIGCRLPAECRAPRALALGPTPGGRRRGMSQTRRLAAILAADVAGYSRLMGADEEGTLERLKALRRELLDPKIAELHGRIPGSGPGTKTTGDGLLVEFASVVDAVRCAVAVQQAMPERNTGVAADNRIELRIGINLGDVIVEGDNLYGAERYYPSDRVGRSALARSQAPRADHVR